ncbi:MAG: adenylate/guanylate cyclase domain-containing protein [Alphaproteobacteria bacterium]
MRQKIRLYSGLILMAFVTTHLLNHIGGIVSLKTMDEWRPYLTGLWGNVVTGSVLVIAFALHICNALYSIYIRATLKMPAWEALQLGFGLAIPVFLASHFTAAFIGQIAYQYNPTYQWVVTFYWAVDPVAGVLQGLGLCVAWIHACIGIHYWLRMKPWYQTYRYALATAAIALLCLSGSGYIAAGIESLVLSQESIWVRQSFATMGMPSAVSAKVGLMLKYSYWTVAGFILAPFFLRQIRIWLTSLKSSPVATTPNGLLCKIESGATLLEALRAQGIPHASVCGGRGRCTTCRVRILEGLAEMASPNDLEATALQRISAPDGIRLACQIKPDTDLKYVALLPPDASASDGRRPGGLEGQEQPITAMFVDLRDSTKLGEDKLPYDVLFILNQFFSEMTEALRETNGHYAQFAGDGLLALYGMDGSNPAQGIRDAIRGAVAIQRRLAALNGQLSSELSHPLEVGIGIHYGDAIVGLMGPPNAQLMTAIGDTINTAARLETQSKQHLGATILSRETIDAIGVTLDRDLLHIAELRGRQRFVEYFAVSDMSILTNQLNEMAPSNV